SCEASATSPVGTYDIVVKQGSVKNFNVAYVKGTLTITKAPLTIAAGTYTKKQGDAMPDFTLSYTGFKNNETKAVLTKQPTVSCSANAASAPGEYPVTVSGAEAQNYSISYTSGKLIVTDADAVIVKAISYTREYGDANPTFEFTTEGAALDGTPEISCEASATSPVGTYDIVVKKGSVKNFNVAYVKGSLTITKAPLTVSAQSCERNQGEENPTFALIYSGWKNSEDESVLTVKPVATTTATKDSPAGEYVIMVDGGDAQNYTFDYVNGILTVSEASAITQISTNKGKTPNHDVLGRKVNSSAKGLLIRDGKVMLVR
ncbi:MAG: hypothetical protein K6E73_03655, partial [Bacteroidales bacterium]|nr:hypothetical protein [Bacteroidales bacterium]